MDDLHVELIRTREVDGVEYHQCGSLPRVRPLIHATQFTLSQDCGHINYQLTKDESSKLVYGFCRTIIFDINPLYTPSTMSSIVCTYFGLNTGHIVIATVNSNCNNLHSNIDCNNNINSNTIRSRCLVYKTILFNNRLTPKQRFSLSIRTDVNSTVSSNSSDIDLSDLSLWEFEFGVIFIDKKNNVELSQWQRFCQYNENIRAVKHDRDSDRMRVARKWISGLSIIESKMEDFRQENKYNYSFKPKYYGFQFASSFEDCNNMLFQYIFCDSFVRKMSNVWAEGVIYENDYFFNQSCDKLTLSIEKSFEKKDKYNLYFIKNENDLFAKNKHLNGVFKYGAIQLSSQLIENCYLFPVFGLKNQDDRNVTIKFQFLQPKPFVGNTNFQRQFARCCRENKKILCFSCFVICVVAIVALICVRLTLRL